MWLPDEIAASIKTIEEFKAYAEAFKHAPLRLWNQDPNFMDIWKKIQGRTLVDYLRCHILYQASISTQSVPGRVAEVGVYKGGTAYLLGRTLGNRALHLFDTFAGMPETDPKKDLHRKGDFSDVSIEGVQKFLEEFGKHVEIHRGFFPETAKNLDGTWSFVHVDADIYQSVLDCAAFFWPRMPTGGIMIFDDYGFPSCPGAKMAVDEYFSKISKKVALYLPTGQYFSLKLP